VVVEIYFRLKLKYIPGWRRGNTGSSFSVSLFYLWKLRSNSMEKTAIVFQKI
jgi:hypothetical protein